MANLHSLAERFFYTNRRTYSNKQGSVAYLDGSPLQRPFDMPAAPKVFVGIIVIAAIVIGGIFLNTTVLSALRESAAAEQAIIDNLAREASIESIPHIETLVDLNDVGVQEAFENDGFTIYNASNTSDSDDLMLYKIPSDMTLEEAQALYSKGISNLTAPQATKLLNGSWQFVSEHAGTTSMVVRYADFSTGDPQVAVQNALDKTGFDPEKISDSGKDDSGNIYDIGSIDIDDKTYAWKISSVPLSDMFSINNMPEEACYVGIRITAQ